MGRRRRLRPFDDPPCHSDVVVDRLRIRHATERRESARDRRGRPGGDGLLVFEAGLTQMHMEIDKAWKNPQTTRINRLQGLAWS